MRFEKLRRGELIATAGGVLLAVSLFLPWFGTDRRNPGSQRQGHPFGTITFWQVEGIVRRVLFLVGAAAPLVLLWIVLRRHQLSWPRGEVTAIVATVAIMLVPVAIMLVLVLGFVERPGEPTDSISLQVGWLIGLLAAIGVLAGAGQRTQAAGRRRKPPGAL